MSVVKLRKSLPTVSILKVAGPFAENKDKAAELRKHIVSPNLRDGKKVVLDFNGVLGATQSFVHALIADPIRKNGPEVIDLISFMGCNESVKGIISIVVEYSQLDVDADVSDLRPSAET
jgi:hypothetical protein